ncbi:hypothetical protein ISN45_Aa05g011740 [Arabidopsis thaliana x Arabidopsis arenosa]|uniref:Telomere repeat-binding protein 1-6-like ubiquitin-like domain-containing protein n=1 Tax=Arabidopsis thaliana x Arabidopsis arenosa TaxID=1240361 RepID=A0A8T1ZMV8_9BRAS|nr:hypothetical protein ISN45_Aa05g011740 [Arabidopsis thaliana x Arabidopsis arenosa]
MISLFFRVQFRSLQEPVEKEVEGFSSLGGSDSCEVRNLSKDLNPGVNGDVKPDVVASIGSNSCTEVGACGNDDPHGSRVDVNLFSRNDDDDENFSGYILPRMIRPVPRIGDRRIRCKAVVLLKEELLPASSSEEFSHQEKGNALTAFPIRTLMITVCKERHIYLQETEQYLPGKVEMRPLCHRDHHVRLRIKSFRVPELFIEIPETATVGSLKRMVMEAVTTILGDGLRVRLMVQGKKVRHYIV